MTKNKEMNRQFNLVQHLFSIGISVVVSTQKSNPGYPFNHYLASRINEWMNCIFRNQSEICLVYFEERERKIRFLFC